jgi:hypothetical protein
MYVMFPQTGTNISVHRGLVSRRLSSYAYPSLWDVPPTFLFLIQTHYGLLLLSWMESFASSPQPASDRENFYIKKTLAVFLQALLFHFLLSFIIMVLHLILTFTRTYTTPLFQK